MSWFYLALACAFFSATSATLAKLLLKKTNAFVIIWWLFALSLPVFFLAFLLSPRPQLNAEFWKTVAVLLPIEILSMLLYLRALKISPISIVLPFLALTPVFSVLTSAVILGERLGFSGITGVGLVSLGAYILNVHSFREGLLAPFRNILREKGALLMLIVAFNYSITSVMGKKAMLISGAQSFPFIYYGIFLAVFTPLALLKTIRSGEKNEIGKKEVFLFLATAFSFAIAMLLHFEAISLVKVPYMIAVKRLSLLVGIFYGAVIFKEKNIGYRLFGAAIMLSGVLILLLFR